jgi:hypothetical protein
MNKTDQYRALFNGIYLQLLARSTPLGEVSGDDCLNDADYDRIFLLAEQARSIASIGLDVCEPELDHLKEELSKTDASNN